MYRWWNPPHEFKNNEKDEGKKKKKIRPGFMDDFWPRYSPSDFAAEIILVACAALTFPDKQNISSWPSVWRRPVQRDIWAFTNTPPWVTPKSDGKFSLAASPLVIHVQPGKNIISNISDTEEQQAHQERTWGNFRVRHWGPVNLFLVDRETRSTIRSARLIFHVVLESLSPKVRVLVNFSSFYRPLYASARGRAITSRHVII